MSKSVLFELDTLRNDLTRIVAAISVINSSMENNVVDNMNVASDALFCVWENLYNVSKRISDVVDQEYAIRRGTV